MSGPPPPQVGNLPGMQPGAWSGSEAKGAGYYQPPSGPIQRPTPAPTFADNVKEVYQSALKALEKFRPDIPMGGVHVPPSDPYGPIQGAFERLNPGTPERQIIQDITGAGKVRPKMAQAATPETGGGNVWAPVLRQMINMLYRSQPVSRVMQSRPQGTAGTPGGKKPK